MVKLYERIKRISVFFLIAVLLLSLPQTAIATEMGSIKLLYQIEGAEFKLYHIGNVNEYGDIALLDDYSEYGVDLESENVATTLASYISSDNIKPLATAKTDKDFIVNFDNLNRGIYLILGTSKIVGDVRYTALPVMVSLPFVNDDESLVWDLEVNGKYEKVPLDSNNEISVLKIWKDDTNPNSRPNEITIELLKDGVKYDTIVLNSDNNWKHTWQNLGSANQWLVTEKNVPNGYEVNIQQDGITFIVTNTYKKVDTPPTPSVPTLPQTGQLWWPVYALIFTGLCFIIVGVIRRGKNV